MTTALIVAVVLLTLLCLALWFMLANAGDYITELEDLIIYLDENHKGGVLTNEAYCELVNEANDIRDARKEQSE